MTNLDNRVIKITWIDDNDDTRNQSITGCDLTATASAIKDFCDAVNPLSLDDISVMAIEEEYSIEEDED